MGVNFSGNQNTEHINSTEIVSSSQSTEIKEEYNKCVEQYKAVMSTFLQEVPCDSFQSNTKRKTSSTKKQTDSSFGSGGIFKKTSSWISGLFSGNDFSEEIDLSSFDELLPSLQINKTLKEYDLTLEALDF